MAHQIERPKPVWCRLRPQLEKPPGQSIAEDSAALAYEQSLPADPAAALKDFAELFQSLAAQTLRHVPKADRGLLQLIHWNPGQRTVHLVERFDVGDAERIYEGIRRFVSQGRNVAIEDRTVRPVHNKHYRGFWNVTQHVVAIVIDSRRGSICHFTPNFQPTFTVATSPYDRQFWYFFDRPITHELYDHMKLSAGAWHPFAASAAYRIPGTENVVTWREAERGERSHIATMIGLAGPVYSPKAFADAFRTGTVGIEIAGEQHQRLLRDDDGGAS